MKKNLMLLMLGLAFSFGAFANSEVKKESNKFVLKKISTKSMEIQQKLYVEYCVDVYITIVECPDGGIGSYVGIVVSDCNTFDLYYVHFFDEEDGYGC